MMYKLLFISFTILSCSGSNEKEGKSSSFYNEKNDLQRVVKDSIPVVSKKENEDSLKAKKWIQYKKIPVMNQSDTIPYENCYITINGNEFSYYRKGKLLEKRTMVRDRSFKYEVYSFKEKPDDYLQYLDKKGNRVVLKRDNYDGEHEYFILCQ